MYALTSGGRRKSGSRGGRSRMNFPCLHSTCRVSNYFSFRLVISRDQDLMESTMRVALRASTRIALGWMPELRLFCLRDALETRWISRTFNLQVVVLTKKGHNSNRPRATNEATGPRVKEKKKNLKHRSGCARERLTGR
jgi:hypothetical protein